MELERIFDGPALTAAQILQSRTERACRQNALLSQKKYPCLISFTLNIPGAVKQFSLARAAFQTGVQLLDWELQGHIIEKRLTEAAAGNEALLGVDLPPKQVKQCAVTLEEHHPLGRLFDIDVLDATGRSISRSSLGFPPRRCLLCAGEAKVCARSQAHPMETIRFVAAQRITNYFCSQAADRCAACAARALLYEVSTTPKPGLVDRANSGAHTDMDYFTFLDSSAVLTPWFRTMFCIGWEHAELSVKELFQKLRLAGRQAERDMFAAARGANTHKGLIFSLGILCGALGCVSAGKPIPLPGNQVFQMCQQLGQCALSDFETACAADTNGLRCFREHQITGARGQAAQGFPIVREIGLPSLRQCTAEGFSLNDAGAVTLLALLAKVPDTNMIRRGGLKTAQRCQLQAQQLWNQVTKDSLYPQLNALDWQYIQENLSPGGCADLLALSFFLFFLEQEGYLSMQEA